MMEDERKKREERRAPELAMMLLPGVLRRVEALLLRIVAVRYSRIEIPLLVVATMLKE